MKFLRSFLKLNPTSQPLKNIPVLCSALSLSLSIFQPTQGLAKSSEYIAVGSAKIKKTLIAFPEIQTSPKTQGMARVLTNTIRQDLDFMDIVKFIKPSAFLENPAHSGILLNTFQFKEWTSIGAEFVIKSSLRSVTGDTSQNLTFEVHVYDTFGAKEVLSRRYEAPLAEAKIMAHTVANDLVQKLTGLPGIFLTKIAMSCDLTGKKEIYMMDFDGSNIKQVSRHRSIAFAPAWSPDGTKLAYSLFNRHSDNVRNIDLYEFDFVSNTIRLLSSRKGMNSGAAYSPNGKHIALTLSYSGNPSIYALDPQTKSMKQLTKSFGVDVDPTWSPDSSKIAFVSSRAGIPMIYSMNPDGSNPTRLTFAGRYNATPTWSPQNNKIGFAGWIDKSFDILIMNPDGSHIERLTKNQGNNEDPFFSPDGNFLVFSSNRTGQKNIYVMNIDGTFVKRLTYGLGNCVSPKWSMPPAR
jgi:TolB protein